MFCSLHQLAYYYLKWLIIEARCFCYFRIWLGPKIWLCCILWVNGSTVHTVYYPNTRPLTLWVSAMFRSLNKDTDSPSVLFCNTDLKKKKIISSLTWAGVAFFWIARFLLNKFLDWEHNGSEGFWKHLSLWPWLACPMATLCTMYCSAKLSLLIGVNNSVN